MSVGEIFCQQAIMPRCKIREYIIRLGIICGERIVTWYFWLIIQIYRSIQATHISKLIEKWTVSVLERRPILITHQHNTITCLRNTATINSLKLSSTQNTLNWTTPMIHNFLYTSLFHNVWETLGYSFEARIIAPLPTPLIGWQGCAMILSFQNCLRNKVKTVKVLNMTGFSVPFYRWNKLANHRGIGFKNELPSVMLQCDSKNQYTTVPAHTK